MDGAGEAQRLASGRMTSARGTRTAAQASRSTARHFILTIALILQLASPAFAHDFGGSSGGGGGGPPPSPPPPCENACGCSGPGGGGGAGGGGGGAPPNRSSSPISYWNGGESINETDLIVSGTFPIVVSRKYDSRSTFDSPLGYGWAFAHDRHLFEYPDGSVVVRYGCGTRDRYVTSGGAYVSAVGGMLATLIHNPDGSWELRYVNGTRDLFDTLGRLTAFLDDHGNRHEFTWDAGGKLPLTGTSPAAATPGTPMVVAYNHRLTRIDERAADGTLSGRYVTFTYNPLTGRLASLTSNDGRSVTFTHDVTAGLTKGNLTQVAGLAGVVRTYAYADPNDEHNLTSITEAPGRTPVVNTYDDQDRVIRQDEGTRRIEFNYQTPLIRTVVTKTIRDQSGANPYTAVTTFDFDATGRITKITDALGHEQRYIYNAAKLLERKEIWQKIGATLSQLQSVNWTYDTAGHQLSESTTLDSGEVLTRSWTYDHDRVATDQIVSSAAPAKIFRTEYTYFHDPDGVPTNLQSEKRRKDDGSFQTRTFTYDARNRLLTTTLPDGVKAVNEYTGDFLTKVYFEVGGVPIPQRTRRFEYDPEGNIVRDWDARNNLYEYTYDDRRRVTSATNPLGQQTIYTWAADDRVTFVERGRTVADGEGQVFKLNYDVRGRVTSLQRKDNAGVYQAYQTYELDSEGQHLSFTDPLNRKTRIAYDVLGRVTSITDPLNKVSLAGYDAAGNRISSTDALGRQTVFERDDLNRLIATVEMGVSPNPRAEYTYDAAGHLTTAKDPEGHITSYLFDALGRNTRITQPLGQYSEFVYDERDRVDYAVNARGQKLDFAYETWGPVKEEKQFPTTSASTADRTISYSRDNDGHVTSVSDDGVQIGPVYAITYDALGRIYDETVKYLPGGDRVVSRRYDRYGNRSEVSLQDSTTLVSSYTFDKLNRMNAANLAGASIGFAYFSNDDRQTITYPGGVTRALTYKTNGPVDTITLTGPSGQIAQYAYTYDDVLNVDTLTDPDGLHDFGYDGLNRMTGAVRPSGVGLSNESYDYDRVGNREDSGNPALYNYDNNNRVTASPGSLTHAYDADGNTATRSDGSTFTHDARNRLVAFTKASTSAEYLQDAFGRRIRKIVGGSTTFYLWDGVQLLAEYSGAGTRQARYAYLDGSSTPAQFEDSNGTYYVHTDHLGTPRLLTGGSGQPVWSARYAAFGGALVNADPDGNSVQVVFNPRLQGQYADGESGLHYNFYRDYDPAIGRYLQSDPIGLRGGLNTYAYAGSNPLRGMDPFGLEVTMICRPVNDKRLNWLPGTIMHCAVIVWHWDVKECERVKVIDAQYSVAGGQTPQTDPKLPTYKMDRDAFNNQGGDNKAYDIAPPPGVSQEQFDQDVRNSGDNYNSQEPYDAIFGPNSNTAADNIIEGAGGVAPDVPGASNQNYGEPWFDPSTYLPPPYMFP